MRLPASMLSADDVLTASQQFLPCHLTSENSTYLLLTSSHRSPHWNRYSLLASSQAAKYLHDGENLQAKIRFCPSLLVISVADFVTFLEEHEKHEHINTPHLTEFSYILHPSGQTCKMRDGICDNSWKKLARIFYQYH